MAAPNRLQGMRKPISVTSSIGARKRGCEPNSIFPIFILFFFAAAKLHLFSDITKIHFSR